MGSRLSVWQKHYCMMSMGQQKMSNPRCEWSHSASPRDFTHSSGLTFSVVPCSSCNNFFVIPRALTPWVMLFHIITSSRPYQLAFKDDLSEWIKNSGHLYSKRTLKLLFDLMTFALEVTFKVRPVQGEHCEANWQKLQVNQSRLAVTHVPKQA